MMTNKMAHTFIPVPGHPGTTRTVAEAIRARQMTLAQAEEMLRDQTWSIEVGGINDLGGAVIDDVTPTPMRVEMVMETEGRAYESWCVRLVFPASVRRCQVPHAVESGRYYDGYDSDFVRIYERPW